MSDSSQFRLLGTLRLCPLFITQSLGAFNDSVYKQGLLIFLVFGSIVTDEHTDTVTNAAAALFILPFFLFSATAGTLADLVEKSKLIQKIKIVEILIAVLIGFALYSEDIYALLGVLFLLGVQSTFFGPLKWSILPQHLDDTEIVGGNAVIEMGTFVAILTGTLLGGVLGGMADAEHAKLWLSVVVVACAFAGYLSSRHIPEAPSALDEAPNWNPVSEMGRLWRISTEKAAVIRSMLGVSWFWLLGSVFLTQIPNLTDDYLNGEPSVVTMILCIFTITIAIGSLTCERLSGHRIEIGLVPVGAIGISLFGIDAFFAISSIATGPKVNAWEFVQSWPNIRLLIDLAIMGFCIGLYVVPMQALIQVRTPQDRRARIIAALNIYNSLFMVLGAGVAILWLVVLDWSIPTLLLFLAVVNAGVAIYICRTVPEFTMRFIIWVLSFFMYRIRSTGLEHIPDKGATLLVCNHVSYVDALLLAGAVRRPIRFVMYKGFYDWPILRYVFKAGKCIPITERSEDEDAYEAAFEAIKTGLEDGDLICIFPEGRLSKDGEIHEFKPGIEKILAESPVQVVPMSLGGLWGSTFSRLKRDPAQPKVKRRFRHPVEVKATEPLSPSQASRDALRDAVISLRGAYQ